MEAFFDAETSFRSTCTTGARQFVVQLAFEMMWFAASYSHR